jgi:hypothetical protein
LLVRIGRELPADSVNGAPASGPLSLTEGDITIRSGLLPAPGSSDGARAVQLASAAQMSAPTTVDAKPWKPLERTVISLSLLKRGPRRAL